MENNKEFEELSSVEQQAKLREVLEQVKLLQRAEIISGEVEISDIAFFRLSNGEIAYDVSINNQDGSTGHMYYQQSNDTLSKIDVEQTQNDITNIKNQLTEYQGSGMDLVPVENQLVEKEQYLQSLDNADKISLVNLEITQKECTDLAIALGMSLEEVELYLSIPGNAELGLPQMSPEELAKIRETIEITGMQEDQILDNLKIDAQENVSIDANAFRDSGLESDEIQGNQKVTARYTFNQIMGLNYDSYRIIKSKTGEPVVVGFKEDGTAERIPEGTLEIVHSENQSMSLIRDDGTIKNVGIVAAFRVNDPGSDVGRDQAIGLYSDNGTINGFYARNASGDRMLAEELPSRIYTSERLHNENILDISLNDDADSEAKEADKKVGDGCLNDVRNLGDGESYDMMLQEDIDELAERIAKQYDVDVEELKARFNEELEHNHNSNLTNEQKYTEIAEEMDAEQRHEPSREPRTPPM